MKSETNKKLMKKLLKIRIFEKLNNEEFIICKANEIIIKNSHLNIETETINQILKEKSLNTNVKKSSDKKN